MDGIAALEEALDLQREKYQLQFAQFAKAYYTESHSQSSFLLLEAQLRDVQSDSPEPNTPPRMLKQLLVPFPHPWSMRPACRDLKKAFGKRQGLAMSSAGIPLDPLSDGFVSVKSDRIKVDGSNGSIEWRIVESATVRRSASKVLDKKGLK